MASSINASTSGAGGVITTADNTGILNLQTASTTAVTVDASQNVGIGTTSPSTYSAKFAIKTSDQDVIGFVGGTTYGMRFGANSSFAVIDGVDAATGTSAYNPLCMRGSQLLFNTAGTERMRITSSGDIFTNSTGGTNAWNATSGVFAQLGNSSYPIGAASNGIVGIFNRHTSDGTILEFKQDGFLEGSISVSGTTVSYNGGHLSRWSQLYNETTKVNLYRGTVLESVNAMCVWEKDGQPSPNEQATKTIVSNTPSSKAVAGVFDRYDEDDETNPYDFYVAQSGDFVIRIAQGVTVQNGDLLESSGDGTARPQADDICRSSTIAKVTSNYVSATYEDGSYCVPCILMIG